MQVGSAVDDALPRPLSCFTKICKSPINVMINAVISLSSVTQEQLEGKLPKGKSVRVAYCRQ